MIGVPDDKWVQSVKAIVVTRDGHDRHRPRRSSSTAAPTSRRTRSRARVEFVDALPRNGFFVDYDALDARFGGGNYPGGRTRSA